MARVLRAPGYAEAAGFGPVEIPPDRERRGGLLLGVSLIAVATIAGVLLNTYGQGVRGDGREGRPLISAPSEFKAAPDDPGGVTFPHADRAVYQLIEGEEGAAGDPHASAPGQGGDGMMAMTLRDLGLPPEEDVRSLNQPPAFRGSTREPDAFNDINLAVTPREMAAEAPPAQARAVSPPPPVALERSAPGERVVEPIRAAPPPIVEGPARGPEVVARVTSPPPAAPPAPPPPATQPVETAPYTPRLKPPAPYRPPAEAGSNAPPPITPVPSAPPPPVTAPPPAAASPTVTAFAAQLSSFRDANQARQALGDFFSQNPELTMGRDVYIEEANLGPRGVHHRVRVGGFVSAAEAEQYCVSWHSRGQECLAVVR